MMLVRPALAFLAAAVALLALSGAADAAEFRGGSLYWEEASAAPLAAPGREVDLFGEVTMRGLSPTPAAGSLVTLGDVLDLGDGSSTPVSARVASVSGENVTLAFGPVRHAYPADEGVWTASLAGCCRPGDLAGGNGGMAWRLAAQVVLTAAHDASPRATMLPVVSCEIGRACQFQLPVTVQGSGAHVERFATAAEACCASGFAPAPGTISLGAFRWQVPPTTAPGEAWAVSVVSEATPAGATPGVTPGASSGFEFTLQLLPYMGPRIERSACDGFTAFPVPMERTIRGSHTTADFTLSVQAPAFVTGFEADLAVGGEEKSLTFRWTPPLGPGLVELLVEAQSASGTDQCLLPITLPEPVAPVVSLRAPARVLVGGEAIVLASVENGFGHPTPLSWLIGGMPVDESSTALTRRFDAPGTYVVQASAKNVFGAQSGVAQLSIEVVAALPERIRTSFDVSHVPEVVQPILGIPQAASFLAERDISVNLDLVGDPPRTFHFDVRRGVIGDVAERSAPASITFTMGRDSALSLLNAVDTDRTAILMLKAQAITVTSDDATLQPLVGSLKTDAAKSKLLSREPAAGDVVHAFGETGTLETNGDELKVRLGDDWYAVNRFAAFYGVLPSPVFLNIPEETGVTWTPTLGMRLRTAGELADREDDAGAALQRAHLRAVLTTLARGAAGGNATEASIEAYRVSAAGWQAAFEAAREGLAEEPPRCGGSRLVTGSLIAMGALPLLDRPARDAAAAAFAAYRDAYPSACGAPWRIGR